MKITFLGASHGVPEPGRKCSAVLVTVGKNRYLVDVGCDVMPELVNRNIPVDSIKGVFISHPHGDHCDGLIPFLDLCNWYFLKSEPKIFLPQDGIKELLLQWLALLNGDRQPRDFAFETYQGGVIFEDEALKVTAIPTKHCRNSYALLLEGEGKRVLYAGDLNKEASDFPHETAQEGLDLLIGESAHFSTLKYVELLKDKPIKQVAITHHFPPNEQFQETKEALSPLPMTLAYDGMEFEI